jgi:plastocyanin
VAPDDYAGAGTEGAWDEGGTMKRKKRLRIAALALAAMFMLTATASAHLPKTITIRHQVRGCHTWSFADGPYKASLKIRVDRDTGLFVVNDDMMPHKLIQLSGPKASITKPKMNHIGAQAYMTFKRAGVYTFTTKPGQDYMKGMKTIGEDNVLRLSVSVH